MNFQGEVALGVAGRESAGDGPCAAGTGLFTPLDSAIDLFAAAALGLHFR